MTEQLKQDYNQHLARYKKAFAYLADNSIPLEEREKWLKDYEELLDRLNDAVNQMKAQGIPYTTKELQEGFEG